MTKPTNAAGATTGDNLIYGPYIQGEIPVNPFNNSNALVATTATTTPTGVVGDGSAGWQYNATTGDFYPNNVEYYATPTEE